MTNLPITRMILYKHGVGFFERRAQFSGDLVTLDLRVEAMNDVLKSLTAIDWGEGQVLGVEYATPQSEEERLAGCSIRLSDDRSLGDLLVSLRGRQIALRLDQDETISGILVGLDRQPERQPLSTALVSVLAESDGAVQAIPLGRVQGVAIEDERGAADLRFFLQTSLAQETHRQIAMRLTPTDHDLSISYLAPAPTWRVSYRLVIESGRALLQGWGIFDNNLEEDLQGVSLSLVAGMPISFVYDLYTPVTPERPEVKEEGRVAAGPVAFGAGVQPEAAPNMMAAPGAPRARARSAKISADALEGATAIDTAAKDLGELFQYDIATPVTVGRGQSAMVPIVSARLEARKALLYNGSKQPQHPVATLRLKNTSGLTLERGPVTVLDDGHYVGEAVLPFTPEDDEIVAPYAVELGVRVREESGHNRVIHGLRIEGAYLRIEEWDVRWRLYRLHNSTNEAKTVLIEHRRSAQFDLFDSPDPDERTDEHWRFAVQAGPRAETPLRVQERRLLARREELHKQSHAGLQRYLKAGLLDAATHDAVAELLRLWEQIDMLNRRLAEVEAERQGIFEAQTQIQGNMAALGAGKEGALRSRYVDELAAGADRLSELAGRETELKAEIERLEGEIEGRLAEV